MVLAVSYKRIELCRILSEEKILQKDFLPQIISIMVRRSSPSILPTSRQDVATRFQMRFGLIMLVITVPLVP